MKKRNNSLEVVKSLKVYSIIIGYGFVLFGFFMLIGNSTLFDGSFEIKVFKSFTLFEYIITSFLIIMIGVLHLILYCLTVFSNNSNDQFTIEKI